MPRSHTVTKGRRQVDLDQRVPHAKVVVRLEAPRRQRWDQLAEAEGLSLARWVLEVCERRIRELEASDGRAS